MSKRSLGLLLAASGLVIGAVSASADVLGFGLSGFGPKQVGGTVVGAAILLVGLFLATRDGR